MEKIIQILIYIHAFFGGIALVAGTISMLAKKGKKTHKKIGKLFFYSMLLSSLLALLIASLPEHKSPFLIAIGVFSLYLLITGYRALLFKNKEVVVIDKLLAILMLIIGFLMIFLPILLTKSINIILTVFALIGMVLAINDLLLYKNKTRLKKKCLQLHLTKMISAYIAAITAFLVVNKTIPGIYGWFIPSIFGSFIIAYWIKKINT